MRQEIVDDTEDVSLDFWAEEEELALRKTTVRHPIASIFHLMLQGGYWWDCGGGIKSIKMGDNSLTEAEARIFWLGLIICPLIWTFILLQISLQCANLYGYFHCKVGGKHVISTAASSTLGQHFIQRRNILFRELLTKG
uniref:Golgi apparatus membrane protein TVP23 homolog n=1 Tax=Erpetoichthys calabaricus TaxID=27687 RepID=A0A8C4TKH5_ERPCA